MRKTVVLLLGLVALVSALSFFLVHKNSLKANHPERFAIASAHPLATQAGMDVFAQGGNAFDAAVAVTAMLAVVEPYSSGIGGGGFYLLQEQNAAPVMLDARETAPRASTADMYLDAQGNVTKNSLEGPLSAGIPGIPAALVHLAKEYGSLSIIKSLMPAIKVAREGFAVDDYYRKVMGWRLNLLQSNAESARIFLQKGKIPEKGFVIKQPELAETLEIIANNQFYEGEFARQLVDQVREDGGIWQLEDLSTYHLKLRKPQQFDYQGYTITTADLPSSGGLVLKNIFGVLSAFDLSKMEETERVRAVIEAMRMAYFERTNLGDPDFIDLDVSRFETKHHEATASLINKSKEAISSDTLGESIGVKSVEGNDTTHFSILDKQGNRVAATLSINYPFGSGYTVKGTGILLNDEMDDFVSKVGEANAYGLVGTAANGIEPGKRPLSSMSPTFVENERRLAILGTPGGSRIISMVMHGILSFVSGGNAVDIVNTPRYHHQFLPDLISFEPNALSKETQDELSLLGYQFAAKKGPYGEQNSTYGNMQAVVWDKQNNEVQAAADGRAIGQGKVE